MKHHLFEAEITTKSAMNIVPSYGIPYFQKEDMTYLYYDVVGNWILDGLLINQCQHSFVNNYDYVLVIFMTAKMPFHIQRP